MQVTITASGFETKRLLTLEPIDDADDRDDDGPGPAHFLEGLECRAAGSQDVIEDGHPRASGKYLKRHMSSSGNP